jgi:hypothetical protein
MLVDATDMTFSSRKLIVRRGVITPTTPLDVHARRLGPNSGRIRFDPATPRGSRITGYRARCVHNALVVTATATASPVTGDRAPPRRRLRLHGPGAFEGGPGNGVGPRPHAGAREGPPPTFAALMSRTAADPNAPLCLHGAGLGLPGPVDARSRPIRIFVIVAG